MVTTNAYFFGLVKLDKEHRTVSFPAAVNQRTGIVEYAVVTTAGKTHESVFKTEAQPFHVQIAMLLLGARPANTNFRSTDLSAPPPGEPVTLEVSWKTGDRIFRRPLEDFIVTTSDTNKSLAAGPWAYNGSHMVRKTFIAQRDGSIVSVQIDPDALVNNPRTGRENDELHCVNTPLLPPSEVPVEITLRLWSDAAAGVRAGASSNTNPIPPAVGLPR